MTPAGRTLWAGRLGIEFRWIGDRFAHRVVLRDSTRTSDSASRIWLESIEQADRADTSSAHPVLQELHIESRPGGLIVALLVGRAAAHHFSASVSIDPAAERLSFELACRVREPSQPLCSVYQSAALGADPACCGEWSLAPLDAPTGQARLFHENRRLSIAPAAREPDAYPATICWAYRAESSA